MIQDLAMNSFWCLILFFSEGVGAVHVQNSGKLYAILLARSAESDLGIISVSSNKVNVCGKSGSFQRVRNESTK